MLNITEEDQEPLREALREFREHNEWIKQNVPGFRS